MKYKLVPEGYGKYQFHKLKSISDKEAREEEKKGKKTFNSRKEALESNEVKKG